MVYGPPLPLFLGCIFHVLFFYAKRVFSQLSVLPQQELHFQGSRPRFSFIFGMFFLCFFQKVKLLFQSVNGFFPVF